MRGEKREDICVKKRERGRDRGGGRKGKEVKKVVAVGGLRLAVGRDRGRTELRAESMTDDRGQNTRLHLNLKTRTRYLTAET